MQLRTTTIPSDEERELRRTVAVISGLLAVHYAHQPLPRRKKRALPPCSAPPATSEPPE